MAPMRGWKTVEASAEPRSSRRKEAHFSNAKCGVRNAEFEGTGEGNENQDTAGNAGALTVLGFQLKVRES